MLNFSKKFIIDYALEDGTLIKKGFQYQMSDVGRLFHGKCVYWIYHGEKKYFVDKRLRIYDLSTSSEMGHFKVTNWTIFIRYKDKLVWQNQEFKFKQDRSDTTGSTWGHFKFLLTSENETVIYKFKIDLPTIALGNPRVDRPFSGTVEITNADPLIALAGLILVERALDNNEVR